MTFGQGDAVWERYGHNAIRVVDADAGTDLAYNWGEFDFDQPNFLGRFLTGDTRYAMRAHDASAMADAYAYQLNRSVLVQELALTPAQTRALVAALRANDTEAARYYRYDYYQDNCSTRVRDALDRALGGAIRRALEPRAMPAAPEPVTWRADTRRLNAADPVIYTGIQLALGRPADRPLNHWEAGYLPPVLAADVRGLRTTDASGRPAPLVRAEQQVWTAPGRAPWAARVPNYALGYLAAGIALGAALAAAGRAAGRGAAGRAALGTLGTLWALVTGLAGTALLLAGTVTRHVGYMGRNWNLLGVNPLGLALAALVVAAVVGGAPARARRARRAAGLAALVAVLAAVGLVATLAPGAGQQSGELFALLVPAHLGLWWALRAASRHAPVR